MKKIFVLLLSVSSLATVLPACTSYAGVGTVGDKAVVAKNNSFLFGILRKVYVCKVTDQGVSNCNHNENP
ncbi:MAG TPA: hypothetical protein VNO21_16620 [Polyangiaceae bacterium]|nr:hypothetical protein [Polyangiaceae bacterium]